MRSTMPMITAAALLAASPAVAHAETAATPLNADSWQQAIERALPEAQRFYGLPDLRFGFLVDTGGSVRTCMALPLDGETGARGQELCDALIAAARFRPATSSEGQPVESVFIARFTGSRAVNATDFAGVPIL